MEPNKTLSTMLTKEHMTIAELFITKIVNMLNTYNGTIETYAIDTGYSFTIERLKLKFNGNTEISISLTRPK